MTASQGISGTLATVSSLQQPQEVAGKFQQHSTHYSSDFTLHLYTGSGAMDSVSAKASIKKFNVI
jgi:hypothetical protein